MKDIRKSIKVHYETWQKLKKQAVEKEISIADLLEEELKEL